MKKLMLNELDSEGLIINSGKAELIQTEYKIILDKVLNCCLENISKDNLIGIYIRGSVAVGRAIKNLSDIDCVVIVKENISNCRWKILLSENIIRMFPFVTMLDLTIVTQNDIVSSQSLIRLKTNLVAQSVCLYGKNIFDTISSVKPDRKLAINLYKNLRCELTELRDYFSSNGIEKEFQKVIRPPKFWCVWIMRDIIRSGLALVMIDKPVYSQDLETCLEVFSQTYPEYQNMMQQALILERNSTNDKGVVLGFLDSFLTDYLALWKKKANI